MEGTKSCRKLTLHSYGGSFMLVLCFLGLQFYEHVHCALNITPKNTVALSGEIVVLNCSSDSNDSLTWAAYNPGSPERDYIFSGGVLNGKVKSYISFSVLQSGHCSLTINATEAAAKRYLCIEEKSTKTASAELIVLERNPECLSKLTDSSVNMTCSVEFFGNWVPIIEWKTQKDQNLEAKQYHSDANVISSTLFLPLYETKGDTAFRINVVLKFNISGRSDDTTATNVPEYNHTISPFITGSECNAMTNTGVRPTGDSSTKQIVIDLICVAAIVFVESLIALKN